MSRLLITSHQLLILGAFLTFFLAGCIRIPQASVDASQLVSEQISANQTSHEAFVSAYFDLSRQRVEDFLINRWIPEYLDQFIDDEILDSIENPVTFSEEETLRFKAELRQALSLNNQDINAIVKALNRSFGDSDRGQTIIDIAEVANENIAAQRTELINPIDKLEKETLGVLRSNYAQLNQLQGSVTAYLQSVRGISANQDAVLERLQLLEQTEQAIDNAVTLNDDVLALLDTTRTAEEIVCQIKQLFDPAEPCLKEDK